MPMQILDDSIKNIFPYDKTIICFIVRFLITFRDAFGMEVCIEVFANVILKR
jgi:hypothetical protein